MVDLRSFLIDLHGRVAQRHAFVRRVFYRRQVMATTFTPSWPASPLPNSALSGRQPKTRQLKGLCIYLHL